MQIAIKNNHNKYIFFFLFTLSGFAGLIYESIWSHYLKLFLGHAAYAQVLVLAIFMGGMALGSWFTAKYSVKWKNLLLGYAIAEGIIGVFGLVFHILFQIITDAMYESVIPGLEVPWLIETSKWLVSAILILPQSILLGMTFPLMSAAVIRQNPETSGHTLSWLYFTNSIGAAVGVLVSGFILIDLVGLPGTIFSAALINIVLAIIVWLLVKYKSKSTDSGKIASGFKNSDPKTLGEYKPRLLLTIALLTGAASFIYEIGWIRMLSLVLGSSTHSFELMLSAFILGIALGGLWVRNHVDNVRNPVLFLGGVQLVMGLLAVLTLPIYGYTFELMGFMFNALTHTESGYIINTLSSHTIAMILMLPTAFAAGMTLPLLTKILLKDGYGERSIGSVYAWNTTGAIIGVFFAIHIGMPLLGLKNLIVFGASIDILLGLYLIGKVAKKFNKPIFVSTAVTGVAVIAVMIFFVEFNSHYMASGVYRHGKLFSEEEYDIAYHKDGKTASIDIIRHNNTDITTLSTNGKPDASIRMTIDKSPTVDESTMIVLAAVALALNPDAKDVANIGMGSGLSTHALLTVPTLNTVDTIEIEPAMVEAANMFRPRVENAYTDKRSRIFIEDAKTFFPRQNKKYDLVLSEPSNPWVSGVSSLFSEEFYKLTKNYIKDDGYLIQWIQLYEIDINLISTIIKALSPHFADYAIFATDKGDILITAKLNGKIGPLSPKIFQHSGMSRLLKRISINNLDDLKLRKLANRDVLQPLFYSYSLPANSDFFPVLDLGAAKTRYLLASAIDLVDLKNYPVPVLEILEQNEPVVRKTTLVTDDRQYLKASLAYQATLLRDFLLSNQTISNNKFIPMTLRRDLTIVKSMLSSCKYIDNWDIWHDALLRVLAKTTPHLTPYEMEKIWQTMDTDQCRGRLNKIQKVWINLYKAIGQRNINAMAINAEILLKSDSITNLGIEELVLSAGMTGYIASGNHNKAIVLWELSSPRILKVTQKFSAMLRLLSGHAYKQKM